MLTKTRIIIAAAGLALVTPVLSHAAQPDAPAATVTLSQGRVGLGLGYSWGRGVLHFQGRDYPFHLVGLAAGDLGVVTVHAVGEVYNLNKVSDFEGKYNVLGAGASAGSGSAAAVEENHNGVRLNLRESGKGLHVNAGFEGVTARFDKPPRD